MNFNSGGIPMFNDYQPACDLGAMRLEIAEKWAKINKSESTKQFEAGRADRIAGKPCTSANGAYLDGWYSISLTGKSNDTREPG